MSTETPKIRIKRAAIPPLQHRCNRCEKPLVSPVEKTSLYVWDGKTTLLICTDCVKTTDMYIWGNEEYLDYQEDEKP